MDSPAEAKTCSRCGAPLTPGALQGLCPHCLLALNLATQTEVTGDDKGGKAVPCPDPPTLEELARHFPGLEILELLGRGGMGAVYKVRQKQLDRVVALKILPPRSGDDSAFAERFTREAKALAKLLHPNIVTLFEFGQADGIYYLLMEFVDGVSLGQLLRSSRVSPREALAIVPQICDALQYAHDQGIVHRDIKPENILLDRRGRVKVADFGLAKLVEVKAPLTPTLSPSDGERVADRRGEGKTPVLTEAGKVMGTPKYMSPEQIEAPGEVDHRADIYALGVVFYQMLTGELPGKPLEPPSSKVQLDVRLDQVVLRALERKPELRYQQVSEVKTCLETIVATPSGSSRREAAQNASGKAGEGLLTSIVRSEPARLTVQECSGARVNYPAMGEVTLYTDRLVIASGYNQRSIPLADIRVLGEAVMPFWIGPGPHRYAAVDFDEAGQRRRLVFLAGSSMCRLPGDTRLHAAEWLTAIQQAVKSGIGGDVCIAHGPIVVPVRTWRSLVWLLVPLLAAIPLIASLLSQRGPGSLSVTNAALMSGAFMLVPVLTLSIVFVVRSCSLRGTVKRPLCCATGSAGGPPAKQGGVKEAHDRPHFSRTAIVGGCFGILGLLALVLYAVIGDSNLLDEGPSNVLAALTALCLLVSAILGWVAVSRLRRSAGKLHGMWLAVSEGLLFPLLALDGLIAFQASTIVETFSAIDAVVARLGIQPASNARFEWLAGIATVFICAVLNTLITWGVWRAVNKTSAGVPPAGSENGTFGKWARGPLLVGTLGPSLVMTIVPWYEGLAEGLTAAIGTVALALALVWGLMSWRQRLGKFVIIATSVVFVALMVAAAVLSFVILPAKQARLQAAFGPVTGCTLPMDQDGWTPLFDLDHNHSVPDPEPGDTAGNGVQHLAQLKKPGVAIHYDGQTHVVAVSGMTIRYIHGDGDPWEKITDTDMDNLGAFLSGSVTGPGSWQTGDFPGKLPLTIFFKTGETKLGLLQITGFTENPHGVKLRYKLVESRASGIGSASSHSTSPAQAATPEQPAEASGSPSGPAGGKASTTNHHLTPVHALAARRGDIGVYLESLGTVQSSNSVLFHIREDRVQEIVRKFDRSEPLPVDAYDRRGTVFGHGVLLAVDNSIDTATGTLACKARLLPVGDNLMMPGLFLNIRMLLVVKHGVVLVPAEAIQRDAESAFVWVIRPDRTVSRRPVQVGTIEEREPTGGSTGGQNAGASGPLAEVKSGVSPGEVVATSDFQNLREGREVRYKLVQPVAQSEQPPQGPPVAAKEAAEASANPRVSQAAEVTFAVTAAGTAPFTYQRRHDTINPAEASSPATGSVPPHGPPFIARLAQGEVELLALSHHPSTNQPWWRPDGTPWTNAVFHNPDTRKSPTKGQRFEFVFRRLGLPQDTTLEYSFEPGTGEVSMASHPWRQGKELPDHNVIETVLPQSAKEVTIKLGVAGGEWKPMVTRTPQAGGGGAFPLGRQTCRALFLDPAESGGEARIAVSYNKVPGWTTRVTALDTSGNLHESLPYGESLDDVATAEGRFPGLSLSRVKQFRFEARPFTWFEFRHIALQPGKRTQVEVVEAEGN